MSKWAKQDKTNYEKCEPVKKTKNKRKKMRKGEEDE